MRKLTKILLVTALVLSLGGSTAASAAALSLHDALEEFKCAAVRGGLSLRTRVAELEAQLAREEDALSCNADSDEAPDTDGGLAAGGDGSCGGNCGGSGNGNSMSTDNSDGGSTRAAGNDGGASAVPRDGLPADTADGGDSTAAPADGGDSVGAGGRSVGSGDDVISSDPDRGRVPAGVDEVTSPAAHAAAEPEEVYMLRAYRGIIGVFDADGNLFRTLNTAPVTLPASDRDALAAGITVSGFDALEALLAVYE